MYRFEKVLRDCSRLRTNRRSTLTGRKVRFDDVEKNLPESSVLVRVSEIEGWLPEGLLDDFEAEVTAAIRGVLHGYGARKLVFNAMAPHMLHGRRLAKYRDRTIACGMQAMAKCAIEERIAMASRRVMMEVILENHRDLDPEQDYGDKAYLVGREPPPSTDLDEPEDGSDDKEDGSDASGSEHGDASVCEGRETVDAGIELVPALPASNEREGAFAPEPSVGAGALDREEGAA